MGRIVLNKEHFVFRAADEAKDVKHLRPFSFGSQIMTNTEFSLDRKKNGRVLWTGKIIKIVINNMSPW